MLDPAAVSKNTTEPRSDAGSPAESAVVTTILLPAYNEAKALPDVLDALTAVLRENDEVLVVDDGSTDETQSILERYPRVRVVLHPVNRGKGAAVITGIRHARGRYIVVCDADASYPVDAIPRIVQLLAEYDSVRCNRATERHNIPALNRFGNRLFDRLLGMAHGVEGTDHLSGLYGLRRDAALRLGLQSSGFDVEVEIAIKSHVQNLRVTTLPVAYRPRLGQTKLRPWRDGWRILTRIAALLLLYSPLRVFVLPGLALGTLSLAGAIVLGRGDVETPYFGLSIHSFIVAALGVLASFQLIVFGIAAALFGMDAGYKPPNWLIPLGNRRVRVGGVLLGLAMALAAATRLAWLVGGWVAAGMPGHYENTRGIVMATVLMVLGLQALSASLFLSLFAGRLKKPEPPRVVR